MWADTLLAAERAHLMRIAIWGGASVLCGLALLGIARGSGSSSPLLKHFGIQTFAWGVVNVLIAIVFTRQVHMRDLAGATSLDRFLWLNIGLDAGYVMVGISLILCGLKLGRKLGLAGAGLGIVTQGFALCMLDLIFAAQISR